MLLTKDKYDRNKTFVQHCWLQCCLPLIKSLSSLKHSKHWNACQKERQKQKLIVSVIQRPCKASFCHYLEFQTVLSFFWLFLILSQMNRPLFETGNNVGSFYSSKASVSFTVAQEIAEISSHQHCLHLQNTHHSHLSSNSFSSNVNLLISVS